MTTTNQQHLQSIKYSQGQLQILDQLLLPTQWKYVEIHDRGDAFRAIRDMQVRGAPAISMVAMLSIAVELQNPDLLQQNGHLADQSKKSLDAYLVEICEYLCSARPTAVNVRQDADLLIAYFRQHLLVNNDQNLEQTISYLQKYLEDLLTDDVQTNKLIGDYGADAILRLHSTEQKLNVLTICNTGSLATAGYGTALGVVRSLHSRQKLNRCYFLETRPYLQGARLTACELLYEKIPSTLICDSMVALLLKSVKIHAVVVGVDRLARNGDFANKIGTYQIALLAKQFDVPFFVACPLKTIDQSMPNGDCIKIEERSAKEMKFVGNVQIAPTETECWNPAFDVTPAFLISGGIVTNVGVHKADEICNLLQK